MDPPRWESPRIPSLRGRGPETWPGEPGRTPGLFSRDPCDGALRTFHQVLLCARGDPSGKPPPSFLGYVGEEYL